MTNSLSEPSTNGPLLFAHIGDLHITQAKQPNYVDFLSIVAQLETECGSALDFVVLPGDNADNGLPTQYKWVATALKMLSVPVFCIPGDHDMEQKSLAGFYQHLQAESLPLSRVIQGVRCLFLDMSGPGSGGPDFRLGDSQRQWLVRELAIARTNDERIVLFMHSYPADLTDPQETRFVNELIAQHDVVLVDMGHTHYNELANDGHVIFSATRSTGQIEEGPVGYALIAVDEGQVSWRFKALHDAFPFVLITSPADYRLRRDETPVPLGSVEVRAIAVGATAERAVACRLNDGDWVPMILSDDRRSWVATIFVPSDDQLELTVEAIDVSGRPGRHTIQLASAGIKTRARIKNGSDADAIGAWPENGILGTQLGPNRNGKPTS
ncbi:metallophosphoesterase family protein [Spirosoma agri]|uniref:Metallophosphoesterase n=1 Tax=Spirosoma agri TaxID=1987381 RepID=A0A6M0ISX2_9BACT|nr:metallophosphoesterase [Spirosoma agri]NEU70785.1 metallophosphoesterase [Spirosoma agri]